MNNLQLCQRLRIEAKSSGSGPSSVLNQVGQNESIVNHIRTAWIDIQTSRDDWLFMKSPFSFLLEAGTRDYLAADKGINNLSLWYGKTIYLYDEDIGESDETRLVYLKFPVWQAQYRAGMNARENARPSFVTITSDNKLRFEARPDKAYRVNGDYKRKVQSFAADNDVPTNLPDDYHMLIVWQALNYLAHDEDAPELLEKAENGIDGLLTRLEISQLPEMSESYPSLV